MTRLIIDFIRSKGKLFKTIFFSFKIKSFKIKIEKLESMINMNKLTKYIYKTIRNI